ncbi:MAG: PhzF family phenazine biosynthesis isomerase, partial [Lachnospiraceae bacterium]|nr:PhzF family phenazine biosynthesis isomerase [Lachnospiraceae bacterium]
MNSKRCLYRKVNAFTAEGSIGNPAAYIILGDQDIPEQLMQQVAKEHAGFVSELVFCSSSDIAAVKLTYFSAECEVDFCGHGTIATMSDLIERNKALQDKSEVMIETNRKGVLKVYNELGTEGVVYITAPEAIWLDIPVTKSEIAEKIGIREEDIPDEFKIEFIDAGLRTLIVPINTFEVEISVYPNEHTLKEFCVQYGIDIILIFNMKTKREKAFAHTRVFAPKYGYLEDTATGSGNSAFAYYLRRFKLWDGSMIQIEQGGNKAVYNEVYLKADQDKILFG